MASFCPRLFSSADIFFKCLFPRWFNVTLNVADFHLHTNQSKDLVFMETVVLRNSSCPEIIEPLLVSSSPTWSQHSGLHCPSSQGSPDGCHLLERMHWSLLFVYSLTVSKKKKMDLVGVSCPDSAIAQALKRWSYHHKDHLNWMLCGRQWNLPEVGCCWRKDVTGGGTVALRTYSPAHLLFILCFLWMAAMWALSFLLWQPAAMPSLSIWMSPLEL